MNFKQWLTEEISEDAFDKWVKENAAHDVNNRKKLYYKNSKICLDYDNEPGSVELRRQGTWKSPFDPNDWDSSTIYGVWLINYSFQNFMTIPNVSNIEFSNCVVDSFRGVEKLTNLEEIAVAGTPASKWYCGSMLRLMKCPNLTHIELPWNLDDHQQIETIYNKHLKSADRDILECQSELIDAGLEHYAKL